MLRILIVSLSLCFSTHLFSQASSGEAKSSQNKKEENKRPQESTAEESKKTENKKPQEERKNKPEAYKIDHNIRSHSNSTETKNININTNPSGQLINVKEDFCGASKRGCREDCERWLERQRKRLKDKLRTDRCTNGRELYGPEHGCRGDEFHCKGTLSYIMK